MYRHRQTLNFEILVVDDDKVTCLLHKNILENKNMEQPPVLFRDGKKALEYLRQRNTPNNCFLIFLDLHMPFFTGWDFLKVLNDEARDCHVHVVLVTSSLQKRDELFSLRFEKIIGFCRKPLKAAHIGKVKKLKEISPYFSAKNLIPKAEIKNFSLAEN